MIHVSNFLCANKGWYIPKQVTPTTCTCSILALMASTDCASVAVPQQSFKKNQFLSTNCRYIHKVLVLTWQAVGPDVRMYSLRPSNPNKIHTLQQYEALIRIKCIQVVVHYNWSLKVAGNVAHWNTIDWIEMQAKVHTTLREEHKPQSSASWAEYQ